MALVFRQMDFFFVQLETILRFISFFLVAFGVPKLV